MENNSAEQQGKNALQLLNAIRDKKSCSVSYKGKVRIFSPHMLAKTHPIEGKAEGRLVVQGFQFGGAGSKGDVTPETGGWRYFYLDEMSDAIVVAKEGDKWYPESSEALEKKEYIPPAFIAKVLAFVGQEE